MSTNDLTDIISASEEQYIDHPNIKQKRQYEFDVIVIGSGPGGG